jgi:hypothetical protein
MTKPCLKFRPAGFCHFCHRFSEIANAKGAGEDRPGKAMPTPRNLPTEWLHGETDLVLTLGTTGATVDSVAKPEQPMSGAEATK